MRSMKILINQNSNQIETSQTLHAVFQRSQDPSKLYASLSLLGVNETSYNFSDTFELENFLTSLQHLNSRIKLRKFTEFTFFFSCEKSAHLFLAWRTKS